MQSLQILLFLVDFHNYFDIAPTFFLAHHYYFYCEYSNLYIDALNVVYKQYENP